MSARYHCDACGWDGEDPELSELQGEGCSGVLCKPRQNSRYVDGWLSRPYRPSSHTRQSIG